MDDLFAALTSTQEVKAEAAAVELARWGEESFPKVETLLESADTDHRWWAVRVLAEMKEPRIEWLLGALRDPSAEVRAGAALALAAHPSIEAASTLIGTLDDDDSMVRALGVSALTAIGNPAVPGLLEAFPEASQRARIHILRALAEIRDPRAISLMMNAMDQESAMQQYWAKEGLERLGLNMVYFNVE